MTNINSQVYKDTAFEDGDFIEVDTYSEHIYDCSFEEIIKKGYNPEDEKQRVDVTNPPIIFSKLRAGIPKTHKISKTQALVFGSKLGVSILQHDNRIKEILAKSCDVFGDIDEFEYLKLNTLQRYAYATPTLERRYTVPGLEWTIEFIRDSHDGLGLTIDQLYVESFLLGLAQSNNIPNNIKTTILQENEKFWKFIESRINH